MTRKMLILIPRFLMACLLCATVFLSAEPHDVAAAASLEVAETVPFADASLTFVVLVEKIGEGPSARLDV